MVIKLFPHIPRESRKIYVSAICLTLLIAIFFQTRANGDFGRFLNKQIFHPFVFSIRSHLKTTSLDPRIKIFAFDDTTVAYLKSTDISLSHWGEVFHGLSRQGEPTILIDKLFDAHPPQNEIDKFTAQMKSVPGKKSLITFAHPGSIRFRDEVSSAAIENIEKQVFQSPPDNPKAPLGFSGMTLYGARPEIINSFSAFGIANYDGSNFIAPFVELKSKAIIPHASLSIAGGINITGTQIKVSDHLIPTNHEGKIIINFFEPSIYRKASISLLPIITRIKMGMEIPIIGKGDYVVILPAMFTGHTDFVDSPFGPIPGGFHLVAILNSVLTNDWITVIDDPGFFVIVGTILGILLGLLAKPSWSILGTLIVALSMIALSTFIFVYGDISVSFVLPTAGVLLGGLCGVALNIHTNTLEEARKNRELEVASLVQKSFFPQVDKSNEQATACRTIGISESASECGGDWWGSFSKNGYTYHFIADAVGHGVPAALLTSVAYAVSRALELEISRTVDSLLPSDILHVLNRVLISLGSQLTQMTFFIVRIQDATGECIYANAGNPPGLLARKSDVQIDGRAKVRPNQLTAAGNVLGDLRDSNYENHATKLDDGDKIILFTDGLYENRTADEQSQLGKPWLRATIQRHSGRPIEDFADTVWRSYKLAIGNTPPDDDSTLLVIEFDRKNTNKA